MGPASIYINIYIYILAGPAVFRGRLRAFGKCTNGVALSKGRQNLASVRLTSKENSTSDLFC